MNIINYFIYRINTAYDDFLPSAIPTRMRRDTFLYNWGCYLEALDKGDIVLTYFTGSGCRKGIYAITKIKSFDITEHEANVEAQIIEHSTDNRKPLIPYSGNEDYFRAVISRTRGAENVLPDNYDHDTYTLLCDSVEGFREKINRMKIYLPGEDRLELIPVASIPKIDLHSDLSASRKKDNPTSTFWIRPSRTHWIMNPPDSLRKISQMFYRFKKGYMGRIDEFAEALAVQIRSRYADPASQIGAIIGVPLNEKKKKAGETDRVKELGKALSREIGVPFLDSMSLRGDVSRRLYKLGGWTVGDFREDYSNNLQIKNTDRISTLCKSKTLLLVDDVFTDGVTTKTVKKKIVDECSVAEKNVHIATLGLMTKVGNMSVDLSNSWR